MQRFGTNHTLVARTPSRRKDKLSTVISAVRSRITEASSTGFIKGPDQFLDRHVLVADAQRTAFPSSAMARLRQFPTQLDFYFVGCVAMTIILREVEMLYHLLVSSTLNVDELAHLMRAFVHR